MNFSWVTIRVCDLDRSLAFYSGLLHLDVARRLGNAQHPIVMLGKADEAKIELIAEPRKQPGQPGQGVSIGLRTDDLDGLVGELKKNGCLVTGPIVPNPHIRFFFVQDPDGYAVQLVEEK